ncbi:MAG: CBS domain-containing protein [Rhodospirillales bacterium]|nr:CBS domain-containing protein [Rhodospirillales bacterium]
MSDRAFTKVSEVMTATVQSIARTATVAEAVAAMKEHQVSSLAVERRGPDDEFGVITVSDIAQAIVKYDKPLERVNVYEVMSKPVLTVPADMNIKYAIRLLVKFGPSRAVVVDQERAPVGIVTLRDMVLGT